MKQKVVMRTEAKYECDKKLKFIILKMLPETRKEAKEIPMFFGEGFVLEVNGIFLDAGELKKMIARMYDEVEGWQSHEDYGKLISRETYYRTADGFKQLVV